MKVMAEQSVSATAELSEASRYWKGNLDPQNLERGSQRPATIPLRDEIVFASTPDLEEARGWLLRARRSPGCIVDLGAGLGAASFALARRGSWVVAVDSSLERMQELRRRSRVADCAGFVSPVVASAEALPFADRSLPAVFTKSVLIHTDLDASAREISRILSPGGRAALVEPQPGNPFAWIYRNTLAPRAWKSITRYFGRHEQRKFIEAIGGGRVKPFYLFSFLAFYFQFGRPDLDRFSRALTFFNRIDRLIFTYLPTLSGLAWFGVILAEKPADRTRLPPDVR